MGSEARRGEGKSTAADAKALGWALENQEGRQRRETHAQRQHGGKGCLSAVGVGVLVGHEEDFSF